MSRIQLNQSWLPEGGVCFRAAGCLVWASLWCLVAAPTVTLAQGKPGGGTQPQLFSVLAQPDIGIPTEDLAESLDGLLIRGAWLQDDLGDWFVGDISELCGRADEQLVINRPSAAVQLPMLIGFVDEDGDSWEHQNPRDWVYGGDLVINAGNKRTPAYATYFFRALNKDGVEQVYRLDANASITGPGDTDGRNFPLGLSNIGNVYTVALTNWVLSQETGSKRAAYEGPVANGFGDTIIQVERKH